MRSLTKRPNTWQRATIVGIALLTFLSSSLIISRVAAAATTTSSASDGRLVSIYDRGVEKVILTKAATVGEAIHDAGLTLDPKDAVDPDVTQKISSGDFKVNIYRARPVTVVDGNVRQKIMTPYQTPDQIAKDAGITLYDEDKTTMSLSNNIVDQGAGLVMTIDRATPVTFVQYGKTITIRTMAKTVGDMLKEKGVVLATDDSLSVPDATLITAGMTVQLWRNGVQTVTQDEDIPFDTQQIQDADQPMGYKAVQTPGVLGKKTVTYQIDMENGQEVSRTEIQSVTTSQPKDQVEVIGTKVVLPPGSHQDWMAAAGISAGDYGYVEYIVDHEGGWCPVRWQGDPGCTNHGYAPQIGGYGLVQATPGSKMASAGDDWLTNPITQLRWATGYAVGRYGSWYGAYEHWVSNHNW